jgi:hypothetical protein
MNAPVSFRRDSAALLTPLQMGEADRAAEAAGRALPGVLQALHAQASA